MAYKTNLTPQEYKDRITNDIKNSWTTLIIEGITK